MESFKMNTESLTINGVSFTYAEIHRVVDIFYARVQEDPVLQLPFRSVQDWPEHVRKLTHFWWLRLGGAPYAHYRYNPVAKHFHAGFSRALLSRWLTLFHDVLREHLREDQYEFWALLSQQMGQGLSLKNDLYEKEHHHERRSKLIGAGEEPENPHL